ncbi:MAG: hypothetical protein COA50_03775 [Flavobacteriaceae bacterium]|nr:MAG: hypothetical protein COA50_03775 [Flavobacteriaceae bacterium]
MRKVMLALTLLFLGTGLYAQGGLKVGIQGGMPFDDFNDEVSLVVGLDLGYMWTLGEVIDLGVTTSFIHGFAETFHTDVVLTDLSDVQFGTAAAAVRIWTSNSFSIGVEAGQAFGINEGNDGGLYLRPLVGYLMGPNTEVNFSYTSISLEDKTWTTVNFGILHTFQLKKRY